MTRRHQRRTALWLAGLALIAVVSAGVWWHRTQRSSAIPLPCADPRRGCTLPGGGVLQFAGEPSPMAAFQVRVLGHRADAVTVRFEMEGMEMGPAETTLRPTGPSDWVAQAVLPICVQGRHDWTALLSLDGQTYRFGFTTAR